ncbi:MAG: HIT domain-containing protein [Thermoplasmatota archaeon]
MSCLFCRIAAGELPSAELYQDDRVFAFLDINPLRTGHALIVPKRHAARLEETSPEDAAALMRATQRIVAALGRATGAADATVAVNNGPAAGQEVPHVHVHVVPRGPGDGAGPIHDLFKSERPRPSPEDLNDLAVRVQEILAAPGGRP